jgi:hypothetical protein
MYRNGKYTYIVQLSEEILAFYGIKWKHTVEPERPQMTI